MPYPVLFESRRRGIQKFLLLPELSIQALWFPLIKYIVRTYFKATKLLILTIDRTQWRDQNVFVISLIWNKRAIPVFWQILSKRGSSNTALFREVRYRETGFLKETRFLGCTS